ncbi:MAG: NlpC/P60 family protein [Pseudomonadota bacterium]
MVHIQNIGFHMDRLQFINFSTPIHERPDFDSEAISHGLFGENVTLLEKNHNGFFYIENHRDNYKGYVHAMALDHIRDPATHYISVGATLVFAKADIKSPLPFRLPFGAEIAIKNQHNDIFSELTTGGYVITKHLSPLNMPSVDDFVTIAEKYFLSVPYLWGGRSNEGIDCSGLVQQCAFGVNIMLPRDSGPQEKFLQNDVTARKDRQRGDIIFWSGHVGMMVDKVHIIHANAHHMMCVIEPLAHVIERSEHPVSSIKRLLKD